MSPTAMLTLMFAAFAMFAWSASRRWHLLQIGRPEARLDHLKARLQGTWRFAFRQEKMDYYNPAGIAHKVNLRGLRPPQLPRSRPLGQRVLRALQPVGTRPRAAPRAGLRAREGLPRGVRHLRHARLFLLPDRRQAEADGAEPRRPAHHRDHLHDDDRRHGLRRRIARSCIEAGRVLRLGRRTSAPQGSARGWLPSPLRSPASCLRALGRMWPAPAGSLFAVLLQGGLADASSCGSRTRLLDARGAGAPLLEPPAPLEALPRHHGDPERLLCAA